MDKLNELAKECGLQIYDTEIVNENKKNIYRVYIYKNGGISLSDCEKFSKILSPILDVMPPIDGEYYLEVSSPGLERNLNKKEHFKQSIGENVKISCVDGRKIKGKLKLADLDFIEIEDNKIRYDEIKKAKTFL